MKRRVTTGGKASKARLRRATKSKRRVAPAVSRRKRSSDIDVQEQVRELTRELTKAREEQTHVLGSGSVGGHFVCREPKQEAQLKSS